MSHSLSVILVYGEDHERGQLRAAFEALSGVQIAGERPDLRSGLALARQIRPDVLVLELAAPVDDALNAAAQYRMEHPEVALFLATDLFDPDTLLRAMRIGVQEILRRPVDRGALGAAIERVTSLNARKQGTSAGHRVITVFSNKGGLGCSSLAVNLALSLRRDTNLEVALADLDHQSGDLAFMMSLEPTRSIADVLGGGRFDSAGVQDALARHPSGVCVLPQPEQLDRADAMAPRDVGSVLEVLSAMFDYVVVDAPHGFSDVALEIFDRSSVILLVTELSVTSARAARRALDVFHRLNYLVTADRVRPVVNRFVEPGSVSLAQFEETLGMPVVGRVANDYAAASRAVNLGRPMCTEATAGLAARDIVALARAIARGEQAAAEPADAARPRKPGLWPFGKRRAA